MRRRHAFTLMELLIVIVIIGILSGLTIAGVQFAFRQSDAGAIKSRLGRIEMALEAYRDDWGHYPIWPRQPYTPSATFYTNTNCQMDFPIESPTGKSYLEFSTEPCRQSRKGAVIYYQFPGHYNREKYDIIAPGPDESFDRAQDNISNWQKN